ncbi:MAG: DUF6576 domain-containing protein, partial [Chthoniobacterales bacterium]
TGYSSVFAGANTLQFAIFISFVFIYPDALLLFSLRAKWVGLALFAVSFLAALSMSDWTQLLLLCIECGTAGVVLRALGVRSLQFEIFKKPIRPHVKKKASQKITAKKVTSRTTRRTKQSVEDHLAEIDPILDKIAKSGLASLSDSERSLLEQAREKLLLEEKK